MKNSAGHLLKNLFLFPLKVLLRVFEISLFVVVATVITLAILSFSRTSQPMVMPEAQKMTYAEFIDDRAVQLQTYEPGFRKIIDVDLPIAKAFMVSIPATISTLTPGAKIDRYFSHTPHFFYITEGEPRDWSDLPRLFWETFERASWAYLVFDKPQTGFPVNPNLQEPIPAPDATEGLDTTNL